MNFQYDNGLAVNGITNKDTQNKLKTAKKPTKSSSIKTNDKKKKNVVDKVTKLGSSKQVILVTTKGYNTNKGKAQTFAKDKNGKWDQKLSKTVHIDKNGFTNNKKEGDLRSPTAICTFDHALGHGGNPGTKLNCKKVIVWVDDP